jgi:hypothetical protein
MINKRGAFPLKGILWTAGIVVLIILIWFLVTADFWPSKDVVVDKTTTGFDAVIGTPGVVLNYIFGGIPNFLIGAVGQTSALVITLCAFVLIFLTFGDVIEVFGSFSRPVAWASAFLIAVIAANLKGIVVLVGAAVGLFAFLGSISIFVGLGAAFFAFLVVNLGLKGWAPWLMRRRAMIHAQQAEIKTEAGAKKVTSAIKGMKDIGDELGK